MSLFSSIRMAANALQANQIAMQVVGQNIANVNTPGYIREEIRLAPAPTQRKGHLLLGLGVEVEAIVQKLDSFLEGRLRGSVSDRVEAETRESVYMQLEGLIGELSDTDLSTAMNNFFSAINDVLNQPESVSVRNLAVLQGNSLTTNINRLSQRASEIRTDLNDRIINMAGDINRLLEEISRLNLRIADTEGGDISTSDAVGLRDIRLNALQDLAKLIDIDVKEQPGGGMVVSSGGDFLVFGGVARHVEVVLDSDRGLSIAGIHISETDSALKPAAGELAGLLSARDDIIRDFLEQMDDFTATMVFEFNKIYSRGQGITGFVDLTAEFAVNDTSLALDSAGLEFTPTNGSLQVMVQNKKTGQTKTTDIMIDLDGLGDDMTLEELATALDDIDGISSSVLPTRKLAISSDSKDLVFYFSGDSSGVLAALGLNTFFSGSTAMDVNVNEILKVDPAKFAASRGGLGADTENAIELAAFLDYAIASKNDASLAILYNQITSQATHGAAIARSVAEGARVFEQTLYGQKLATSGVSLDEEAVSMLAYQRAFQAAARYIATLDEMFELLVTL
jgi:flagellar hook-associated protein 1 FlgK